MDIDYAELDRLAKGAIPGPWMVGMPGGPQGRFWMLMNAEKGYIVAPQVVDEATARYIAAVSPDVVLELLRRISETEKVLAEAGDFIIATSMPVWRRPDRDAVLAAIDAVLNPALASASETVEPCRCTDCVDTRGFASASEQA